MANVKITELTAATALAGTDVLPIVDVGADATKKVSVSDLLRNLPDGTASAPALAFADDQNTGVLSPAANELAFATSGTQRLVIDSSGNCGIGTDSPTNGKALTLNSSSNYFGINFQTGGTNIGNIIQESTGVFYISSNQANGQLVFRSGAQSEAMRIDSSGRVGIGTSSPTRQLQVSAATAQIGLTSSDSTLCEYLFGDVADDNVGRIRYEHATNNLNFWTNASERLRIDSSGRLLVGTTTEGDPSADNLTVADSGGCGITIRSGTSSTSSIFFSDATSGSGEYDGFLQYRHNVQDFKIGTAASTRLTIDSSGRVGVGATDVNAPLEVRNWSALQIRTSTGTGNYWEFGRDNSTGDFFLADDGLGTVVAVDQITGNVGIGTTSPNTLLDVAGGNICLTEDNNVIWKNSARDTNRGAIQFTSGGEFRVRYGSLLTEGMRIDSSGRLLVGATSGSYDFEVKKSGHIHGLIGSTNAAGATLLLDGDSNGDGAGSDYASVSHNSDGNLVFENRKSASIIFRNTSSSTERLRIDSSGRLLVGETHAIADFSNNLLNISHASGAGIQIGRKDTSVAADNLIGSIQFRTDTGSGANYESSASIEVYAEDTHAAGDSPGRLTFSTSADGSSSPTERMRIEDSGRTAVYSTEEVLSARSSQAAGTSYRAFQVLHSATSTTTGTGSFIVYTNGDAKNTNNSYGAISDARLKENIVDASSQWDDIKDLRVRNYNFIEGQTHTQIGVIAQEVETVSPGLVTESPDRDDEGNDLGTTTKSVNYSVLYMKAVKALQEAMDRIETLEAKVAALEAQ